MRASYLVQTPAASLPAPAGRPFDDSGELNASEHGAVTQFQSFYLQRSLLHLRASTVAATGH
jgi:hypothetical protein